MKPRLYVRFGWWYCENKRTMACGIDWRGAWNRWAEVDAKRAAKLKPKGA